MHALTSQTFRLPVELREKAAKKASETGISLAVILRNALDRFLREDEIVISTAPLNFGKVKEMKLTPKLEARAQKFDSAVEKAVARRLAA